ncbi:MAG: SGNH/GDSL hydrolase family protein [Propionibacteriaceae bacterium]|nr:SGNH/GDSL hydrolase family protein [Propionibacteriaceae bacterium]
MRRRNAFIPAVIGTLLSLLATPAHAASRSYIALGDSYSSGLGSRDYYFDGTRCFRSPKTYGALIATSYGLDLTLVACAGAKTADVVNKQVSSLNTETGYASITVGGNDVGFSSVLTECAMPGWLSNCNGAIDGGLKIMRNELPGRLTNMLATIKSQAPNARVVLAGYPHIFNGQDCHPATFFSAREEQRLNDATDELNTLLRTKVADAGMNFVNPVPSFWGHAVCDDPEWINGLSFPIENSFHPNTRGYRAYARLVGPALVGSDFRLSVDADRRQSIALVKLPRGTTSSGSFEFKVPDLNTARAERAARKAGITTAELDQLRRAQRNGASNAALERLDERITEKAAQRRGR